MPRYKVLEPTFINGSLLPAGTEIDYDGKPGSTLEALDNPYRARRKAAEAAGGAATEADAADEAGADQ